MYIRMVGGGSHGIGITLKHNNFHGDYIGLNIQKKKYIYIYIYKYVAKSTTELHD